MFYKTLPVRIDLRNIRAVAKAVLNPFRFRQRYAEAVVRQTAKELGHKIVAVRVVNGSVHLTIRTKDE